MTGYVSRSWPSIERNTTGFVIFVGPNLIDIGTLKGIRIRAIVTRTWA